MSKSQLFKCLQKRLIYLLQDATFADARLARLNQNRATIEDAIVAYNFAVSVEILGNRGSSIVGEINPGILNNFRKSFTFYIEKNGVKHDGYRQYIQIICEYLAMVAQKPLHPSGIRHLQNNPPEDIADRWYCSIKAEYIKEPFSLCRFCQSISWPEI